MWQRTLTIITVLLVAAGFGGIIIFPSLVGFAIFVIAVVAATLTTSPSWLVALCLVSIQVGGEALRPPGMPIAVTQVLCVLAFITALRIVATRLLVTGRVPSIGLIDISVVAFMATIVAAVMIGWVRGAGAQDVRQDAVSFVFLAAVYVAARTLILSSSDLRVVVAGLLVGTILAAGKLAALIVMPIEVSWDGPWQAVRLGEPGSLRIILRGADMFFVVAAAFVFARWLAGRKVMRWTAIAGVFAIVGALAAGTRSNWIGLVAGATAAVVTAGTVARIVWRRVFFGCALACCAILIALMWSPSLRTLVASTWAAAAGRTITMDVRAGESRAVLRAVLDAAALGSGMGSTFQYYNPEVGGIVTAPFSHNAYWELLWKTGVTGLITFLLLAAMVLRDGWRIVRRGHPWRENVLGFSSAVVAVLVLSVGVNKIFTLSGAMFLGLSFAIVQNAHFAQLRMARRPLTMMRLRAPAPVDTPRQRYPHEFVRPDRANMRPGESSRHVQTLTGGRG